MPGLGRVRIGLLEHAVRRTAAAVLLLLRSEPSVWASLNQESNREKEAGRRTASDYMHAAMYCSGANGLLSTELRDILAPAYPNPDFPPTQRELSGRKKAGGRKVHFGFVYMVHCGYSTNATEIRREGARLQTICMHNGLRTTCMLPCIVAAQMDLGSRRKAGRRRAGLIIPHDLSGRRKAGRRRLRYDQKLSLLRHLSLPVAPYSAGKVYGSGVPFGGEVVCQANCGQPVIAAGVIREQVVEVGDMP
ncbi:hypothetical protein C8J57DRAFT_1228542 [Mycena rebaudengoi]|nr:hypothetical protein C8J57DRAFT_1228542 [Mycena rebaudengoi]